jgi:hypothetical protein
VSDALKEFEDIGTPESAIFIAVIEGAIHVAYSKDLTNDYDGILDILEIAAKMVISASADDSKQQIH